MKRIRIDNDIDVAVYVRRDGAPENFSGKEVALYLQVAYVKIPITEYSIVGNVIKFRYSAESQKHAGKYSLVIQVKSADGTNTVDKCEVFELVNRSCQTGGTDEPNIETVSVEIGLDMHVDAGGANAGSGGGTTDYSELQNKPSINKVVLEGNKTSEELGLQPQGDYITGNALAEALSGYVQAVAGKGLSTNDLTNELLNKLNALSNYDDTSLRQLCLSLQQQLNTLLSGNVSSAIESFNEIIAFLANVEDSETLEGIIAGLNKRISDVLSAIPTKTSQLTNDSGYLTKHQDLTGYATQTWASGQITATIGTANELLDEINNMVV
ncbi:MAG: hypothetical protein LUF01_14490 [Bacteroides sp.]|nr:hypothetical protein [Bacteroides sp.]